MDIVSTPLMRVLSSPIKRKIIIYINKVAVKILKIPNDDILGQNISKALPFCKLLLKTLQTGKKYLHHEVYAEEYDNHYMVSSQPLLDENNNLYGGVAVIRDMETVRQIYQKSQDSLLLVLKILFTKVILWKINFVGSTLC